MDIIEDQDMPGRSRNRVLENHRNVSRTRSSSTHNPLGARKDCSRTRRIPTTVLAVLNDNIKAKKNIENSVKESYNSSENINLSRDRFSKSLIYSGLKVSPDPQYYQRAKEKHKTGDRVKRNESSSKRRSAQHRRLDLDYEDEEIDDYSIQNDLPLDNITKKLEEDNEKNRYYKYGNPDNSIRGLQTSESADLNNIHSDLSFGSENRTNATTPSSVIASAANKIYNRMSKIFAGEPESLYSLSRVSSCYTLKGNEQLNDKKVTKKNGLDETIRTGSLDYESELDDEETELDDYCEPETVQKIDAKHRTGKGKNVISNNNDSRRVTANAINYKETLQEINDFQNNFVKKYNNATPTPLGNPSQKNTSRTLQKILDYKDLYSEEEDSTNSTSSANISSKWHPVLPGSSSFDYGIKIQHEAIMSEYTQIKLRFSSSLSGSSAETFSIPTERFPSKLQMKSKAGVLGYIDRSRYFGMQDSHEKEHNVENSNDTTDILASPDFPAVDSENKDGYISKLWKSEVDRMFPAPDYIPSSATYSSTPDLGPPRKMSIDLRSEDCDIYENRPNSHSVTKSIDLSQMARNVRFKRYA